MKKRFIFLVILLMTAVVCTTACQKIKDLAPRLEVEESEASQEQINESSAMQTDVTEEAEEEETQEQEFNCEDTYWVAVQYEYEEVEGIETIRPEEWWMDLVIRNDGTARFRDVHESICLVDDSLLDLAWTITEDEEYLFYNAIEPEPILRGRMQSDGTMQLSYYGITLTMKQDSLPQTVGEAYTSAELAGTWLLVSGEAEGWEWAAMPGELSDIVIKVTSLDGPLVLIADIEERDYYGDMTGSVYSQQITVLQEPLYQDCENEAWSIRIGAESPVDENGYPTETEIYATLLDYNTMLVQRYYTMDGYPAVSYQTYWRMTDYVSWMSPESMHLDDSIWTCMEYVGADGEAKDIPEELTDFSIVLNTDLSCVVEWNSDKVSLGTWMLENGGVILLRSDEASQEEFWFGGVISGYVVQTAYDVSDAYQMSLYYNGGILKLRMNGYF